MLCVRASAFSAIGIPLYGFLSISDNSSFVISPESNKEFRSFTCEITEGVYTTLDGTILISRLGLSGYTGAEILLRIVLDMYHIATTNITLPKINKGIIIKSFIDVLPSSSSYTEK